MAERAGPASGRARATHRLSTRLQGGHDSRGRPDFHLGAEAHRIVRLALAEDMPWGDLTTELLVPKESHALGKFVVRESGTIAGLSVAEMVFAELDRCVHFVARVRDGDPVGRDDVVAEVSGPARPILSGERTALNLLQRMSGIATTTAAFVRAIEGTRATIVDTRKTAPVLRVLDKFAVRCGGGSNHRFSLSDAALVKDNHLAALAGNVPVPEALRAMRRKMPHTARLEVEVDRPDQIEDALAGGADIILLDNMNPEDVRLCVLLISGRALVEASGGIGLKNVREIAETGVDLISVGALTHSVRSLDIGLDLEVE